MAKPGMLIIFIVIFLIAVFYIYKLDICRNKFSDLKNHLHQHQGHSNELMKKVSLLQSKKVIQEKKKAAKQIQIDSQKLSDENNYNNIEIKEIKDTPLIRDLDVHTNNISFDQDKVVGASSRLVEDKRKDSYIPQGVEAPGRFNFQDSSLLVKETFDNPPSEENGCWVKNNKGLCHHVEHPINMTCYSSKKECTKHGDKRHPECPPGTDCVVCENGSIVLNCPKSKKGCYPNSKYYCPKVEGSIKTCENGTVFKCKEGSEGCFNNSSEYCDPNNKVRIVCGKEGGVICHKNDKHCVDYSPTYCYNFSGENPKVIRCKNGSYRVCPSEDPNCHNLTTTKYCKSNSKKELEDCYKKICMPYKHLLTDTKEHFQDSEQCDQYDCPPCQKCPDAPQCPPCLLEESDEPICPVCPVHTPCPPCQADCSTCPPEEECPKCPEMICPPCPKLSINPVVKAEADALFQVYPSSLENFEANSPRPYFGSKSSLANNYYNSRYNYVDTWYGK